MDRIVPFRAGGPSTAAIAPHLLTSGPHVLLTDISEFQPDLNDALYLATFSKAAIIRAAYGDAHADRAWYGGDRRSLLHAAGCRWLGIYQYIVATQDVTAQAKALVRLL